MNSSEELKGIYSWKISKQFLQENIKSIIIFLIFTALAYPLESIAVPQLYSKFFESLHSKTNPEVIIRFLIMIAILLLIVKASDGVIHYLESKLIPSFNEYILNYIYTNLLVKYQNNYTDIELGKLISRINTIPTIMRELSTDITIWVFPKIIAIIIINIYFFFLNPILGFVSLILVVSVFVFNYYMCKKCVPLSNMRHHLLEKNSEEVQNKLSNLSSIYSSGKMKEEIHGYLDLTKNYKNKYKENLDCVNTIRYSNGVLDIVTFILLNGVTAYLFIQKKISFTTLMAIFITIIYYLPCISTISSSLPDLVHYFGVIGETDDFLKDLYDQSSKIPQKPSIQLQTGRIDIQNLQFGYSGRDLLFKNFNLNIEDKQKVCIIGSSGNGKSTLIKLLMGYYPVNENMILLDHKDITKYDVNSVRSQISYVNQNNKLFNGSIYENIQYGNSLNKKEIDELVNRLDLSDIYGNLKDGFNTDVGVGGDALSGGQKQIIHILRTFGKRNKIIILDEPTGAIDPHHKNTVLKVIKEISKNSTLILITHDESIMNMCDRIITIENGKVVNDKTYKK
jgi:ABC-type multidrug transport system fused ATPase/permease subunit